MKQLLKEYISQDVFIIGDSVAHENHISLTDDYETLWIKFPDRIERFYLDTNGDFTLLENIYNSYTVPDNTNICVLEQFTGKLYIDVIGDVTEVSILKDDWNREEYLIKQLLPYDVWKDYPEFLLYVEGDYDDVYTTTLEEYLGNRK